MLFQDIVIFLIDFRWLLFYWIGVVLVDLCKGLYLKKTLP
ncbi:hypothetical protein [uncultured Gammaproteobacteria bacterium]|nr:hypothetical protein [uncultured Gammaproteobacteria bacterium]CAC9964795.1 hypothetical protein [uncultured Gammaproteobacteria bacterium]